MAFVQNFPFFSIILSMFAGIVSSVLPAKAAKWLNTFVISAVGVMSLVLLRFLSATGRPFVYWMGHFPAPWGNEIRAGLLEAGMAVVFCVIMLLSMLGGRVVWGLVMFALTGISDTTFSFTAFAAGAFTNAIPGIILHIVLIPVIVLALRKAKLTLNER